MAARPPEIWTVTYGCANRSLTGASPKLWIGKSGPTTPSGIYQVVRDRAIQAGVGHVYPPLLRHTFAHMWLSSEGAEGDSMRLAGWHLGED